MLYSHLLLDPQDDYFSTCFPQKFCIFKTYTSYDRNMIRLLLCVAPCQKDTETGGKTPHSLNIRWGWAVNFIPFTYLSGKPLASTGYIEWACRDIPNMVVKRKTSNVPAIEFNHSQWVFHVKTVPQYKCFLLWILQILYKTFFYQENN